MQLRATFPLALLGLLAACDATPDTLNNGESGQVSLAMAGVPAEHQPFQVRISVKTRQAFCDDGDACIRLIPIVGMAAGCDDETVCSIQQQEPIEDRNECVVTVDAGKAGQARLMIEVETETGEVRRDTFLINVARPTEVEVACEKCDVGLAPGEETTATCALFNRDVSAEPLMGTCDAWSTGRGVEIVGMGDVTAEGVRQPHVVGAVSTGTGRTFGNVFTVRKTMDEGAELVFSGGDVERHLMTR